MKNKKSSSDKTTYLKNEKSVPVAKKYQFAWALKFGNIWCGDEQNEPSYHTTFGKLCPE